MAGGLTTSVSESTAERFIHSRLTNCVALSRHLSSYCPGCGGSPGTVPEHVESLVERVDGDGSSEPVWAGLASVTIWRVPRARSWAWAWLLASLQEATWDSQVWGSGWSYSAAQGPDSFLEEAVLSLPQGLVGAT